MLLGTFEYFGWAATVLPVFTLSDNCRICWYALGLECCWTENNSDYPKVVKIVLYSVKYWTETNSDHPVK